MSRRTFGSMRIALSLLACLSIGLLPCAAAAQPAPLSEEFVVNTHTTGEQTNPAIATDAAGNFLVVWESANQPPALGISVRGQRYLSTGAPIGTEFQINTAYAAAGSLPDVAMSADGSFLVVWRNSDPRHTPRISGRYYNDQAEPVGGEFSVDDNGAPANSYTNYGYRSEPAVAAGPAGFVVVWSGGMQYLQFFGFVSYMTIRGQRFDTSGAPSGTEFEAGGSGRYWTTRPDVAVNAAGGFVVVWAESSYHYGYDSYGGYTRLRTFHALGRELDSQGARGDFFSNGSDGFNGYRGTAVATTDDGGFIVAWDTSLQGRRDVRARRYDSSVTALDSEFIVSTRRGSPPPTGVPFAGRFGLDLSANDSGQFTVVWTESSNSEYGNSDGSSTGVFARTYTADGTELGAPVQVNSYTTSEQAAPAIAALGNDELIMTWRSYSQDGDARAVIARRFARTPDCGDATADGQTTASDGLLALRAAVGAGSCALCICDADRSGQIVATDAFLILEVAVGKQIALTCGRC